MKKLIFRYSAMNAGKTANLLMTYFNYNELNLNPVIVVPNTNKSEIVYSRIGLSAKATKFEKLKEYIENNKVDCVLVDEAQFLTKDEVEFLNCISIHNNITVICYGLRTTSTGTLFEGSKYLMAIADIIEELPTLCSCGEKARMNLRLLNGEVDKSNVVIKYREEQSVAYVSLCRKCFHSVYNNKNNNELIEYIKKFDNTINIKNQ